jgi:flagellar assembly protein FliH
MSEHVAAPFRPAAVGGVLDGSSRQTAQQAERARAAGWSAGWAAGTRAAADAAEAQRSALHAEHVAAEAARDARVDAALVVLRRAAEAATARTVPLLQDAAATLDEGVVLLTQAVLGAELSDDEDRARAALARALSLPLDAGVQTVRLHPADLAVVTATGATVPAGVQLVADSSLRPGDAVSELADGYLDARISTAVERALHALAGVGELPGTGDLA